MSLNNGRNRVYTKLYVQIIIEVCTDFNLKYILIKRVQNEISYYFTTRFHGFPVAFILYYLRLQVGGRNSYL